MKKFSLFLIITLLLAGGNCYATSLFGEQVTVDGTTYNILDQTSLSSGGGAIQNWVSNTSPPHNRCVGI